MKARVQVGRKRIAIAILLLAMPIACLGAAKCEDEHTRAEHATSERIWAQLMNDPCMRKERDHDEANLRLDPELKPGEARKTVVVEAWTKIVAPLNEQVTDKHVTELPGAMRAVYKAVLDRAWKALASTEEEPYGQANEFVGKSSWELSVVPAGTLPRIVGKSAGSVLSNPVRVKATVESACQSEGAHCPVTYRFASKLIIQIELSKVVATYYGAPLVNNLAQEAASVDKQWDEFLFQGKPMYPLDLLATDFMNSRLSGYGKSQSGLRTPPKFQYFFLHPALGIEYVGSAAAGDRLKPSVYVEIIGFNDWRSHHFSGASLIAAYADRAGTADLRGGVLFTYSSKVSAAVTFGGGDFGVMIGVDLAGWYAEKLKPAVAKLH